MIVKAVALPYIVMRQLYQERPDFFNRHRCISIIEPRSTVLNYGDIGAPIFPEDSERAITLRFDEMAPTMFDTREEYERVLEDFRVRKGLEFVVFDEHMADRIIDFLVHAHKAPGKERLFSNCIAGIARSGAVVRFVADVLHLDEAEFAELNPDIEPHEHVLAVLHDRWRARGLS
jgi:predicted protein tyrosine phosphatase